MNEKQKKFLEKILKIIFSIFISFYLFFIIYPFLILLFFYLDEKNILSEELLLFINFCYIILMIFFSIKIYKK